MKIEYCLASPRAAVPSEFACRHVDLGELQELSYNWWLRSLELIPRLLHGQSPDLVVCARDKDDIPLGLRQPQRGQVLATREVCPGAGYLWWAADPTTFLRLVLFWKMARNLHPGHLWYMSFKECATQEEFLHGIWAMWLRSQNVLVDPWEASR